MSKSSYSFNVTYLEYDFLQILKKQPEKKEEVVICKGLSSWHRNLTFELTEFGSSRSFLFLFPTSKIGTSADFTVHGCLLACRFWRRCCFLRASVPGAESDPSTAITSPTGWSLTGSEHSGQSWLLVTGSFVTDMTSGEWCPRSIPGVQSGTKGDRARDRAGNKTTTWVHCPPRSWMLQVGLAWKKEQFTKDPVKFWKSPLMETP